MLVLAVFPAVATAAPVVHTATRDVRACLPLADGSFLAGTAGGLVHVGADGAARATFTAVDGLPGTRIEALLPAEDGSVWVGADGGGARVALVDGALAVQQRIAARPFRDVIVHAGTTYAATWEGGVVTIDRRGRTRAVAFARKQPAARMRVAALASQGETLYAGTAAGLYALEGKRLVRVSLAPSPAAEPAVSGLLADGDRLWIASAAGLFVREADSVRLVAAGDVRRVTRLDGAIATAGVGDGVRVVDRGRLLAAPGGPALVIAQALAARDGGAACAGGLDGLYVRRATGAPWRAVSIAGDLPSTDVSALALDGDRLWVGTFDRGLVRRAGDTWRAIAHPDLDPRINALLVEPRGARARLWIGTAAGLMTLDGDDVARLTRRDGLPGRGVLALARLRDGRIVAGTTTGAAIVGDNRAVAIGPPAVGNVWAVAEDDDGLLWLGTTTGVWRGPSTPRAKGAAADGWQRYSVATGHLHDDWVMAIAPRGRSVWVGSYKGGVVRFDLPASTTMDTVAAPLRATHLGDAWINPGGLVWDGDTIVASTQDGLRTGDGRSARWSTLPGLPGKDVTAYVRAGATRWIATRRGLVEDR